MQMKIGQQYIGEHRFDESVMNLVDRMEVQELDRYTKVCPSNLPHYMSLQRQWVDKGIGYLGETLHHPPTQLEIADYVLSTTHCKRFRAYYVLKYDCC